MDRSPPNWVVNKYQPRNILPFPSGEYDSFRNEIKRYIIDLVDNMKIGSDLKNMALNFADSIYWEPARPSTLAGVCVLMAGSNQGVEFKMLSYDIAKSQRKMVYSYYNWYPIIEKRVINNG